MNGKKTKRYRIDLTGVKSMDICDTGIRDLKIQASSGTLGFFLIFFIFFILLFAGRSELYNNNPKLSRRRHTLSIERILGTAGRRWHAA